MSTELGYAGHIDQRFKRPSNLSVSAEVSDAHESRQRINDYQHGRVFFNCRFQRRQRVFRCLAGVDQNVRGARAHAPEVLSDLDRKSTRLNSSHEWISYAV